jgi:hypothetical protein
LTINRNADIVLSILQTRGYHPDRTGQPGLGGFMAISISKLTVNNNAIFGTVVDMLSAYDGSGNLVNCSFSLTKGSTGLFAIVGNNLVSAWTGSIPAGYYFVRINAAGTSVKFSGKASFEIQVQAPPPPPPPPGISPDGSILKGGAGGSLRTAAGMWSFAPTQNPDGNWSIQLNGVNQGVPEAVLLQVENGGILYSVNVWGQWYSWQANGPWTGPISPVFPLPGSVRVLPSGAPIPDNSPAGTYLATVSVATFDGLPFAGILTTSDTNFFAISGMNVVTARALTPADDGTHTTVITADQGGKSMSTRFSI